MQSPSKIFSGFRALGYVSNHVPVVLKCDVQRRENYVVTCVGKAFHTYNCSKFGIQSVSDSLQEDIQCLAADGRFTFVGSGKLIHAFSKGRKVVHTYEGHTGDVELLLPFGHHLVSVSANGELRVWDIDSEEEYLKMGFDEQSMRISAMVHPVGYTNKILLGTQEGFLQLWNIKEDKMLHTFKGWEQPVMTLTQSPAVDVIAVGLEDGSIILHNIRYDELLMKFKQDWGAVTAVSFRTDGPPIMVSGSQMGHMAVWDLEKRRILCQMREAHGSAVCGLHCLPGEPLMVSNSADNSLKMWIFDMSDGSGRVLRERCGHSAPPTQIRYYGDSCQTILSAGQDSVLRSFSTVHEKHDKSLGRASFNKKASKRAGLKNDQHMMPSISCFAAEPARESDWDSVAACHSGLAEVTTWSCQRSTMGKHRLLHSRFHQDFRGAQATCVDITSCANFVLIGYSSGHVDKFNLQSGHHRGSYGDPTAHPCPVRGVAVDSLNQVAVTAGGDGVVVFWHFKQLQALKKLTVTTGITQIFLHRPSGMLGVSLDDFSLCVVDVESRNLVRRFAGHTNRVTDMAFSPDGRWLISASMDCSLRTWDLPSARLIDCFLVDNAVSSLTVSPVGDFLATTHVDDLGIYLWSNQTLFAHVALMPLPMDFQPQIAHLPQARCWELQEDVKELASGEDVKEDGLSSPEQLGDRLITLALLPESRWKNLLNLDIIKKRNKPKEPPKKPEKAPFLLPTVPGLEPKFLPIENMEKDKTKVSDADRLRLLTSVTAFAQRLEEADKQRKYDTVLSELMEMGPSAVDVELRSLDPATGGNRLHLACFLRLILHLLQRRSHFELAQSHLALFLKIHGETLASDAELVELVREVAEALEPAWAELDTLLNSFPCLLNYCKSATLSS